MQYCRSKLNPEKVNGTVVVLADFRLNDFHIYPSWININKFDGDMEDFHYTLHFLKRITTQIYISNYISVIKLIGWKGWSLKPLLLEAT